MRNSPASAGFPPTLWSQVASAGKGSDAALELLATAYRPVVLRLVTWCVENPAVLGVEPEDLTQEFFLYLTEHREEILGRADAARGRFRAWLRTCLKNWLHNRIDELKAKKRLGERPGRSFEDLDAALPRLQRTGELEREFDRQWARDVFDRAAARLRGDVAAGMLRSMDLDVFRIRSQEPEVSEREIAGRLDLSLNLVHASLRRVLKFFADHLRLEVVATVNTASELDEEIAELQRSLSGVGTRWSRITLQRPFSP